jgi:hypothetical protein
MSVVAATTVVETSRDRQLMKEGVQCNISSAIEAIVSCPTDQVCPISVICSEHGLDTPQLKCSLVSMLLETQLVPLYNNWANLRPFEQVAAVVLFGRICQVCPAVFLFSLINWLIHSC